MSLRATTLGTPYYWEIVRAKKLQAAHPPRWPSPPRLSRRGPHRLTHRPLAQDAVNLGFGLKPIIELVAIDVPALRIEMISRFADHTMAQIVIDLVLRAFRKHR